MDPENANFHEIIFHFHDCWSLLSYDLKRPRRVALPRQHDFWLMTHCIVLRSFSWVGPVIISMRKKDNRFYLDFDLIGCFGRFVPIFHISHGHVRNQHVAKIPRIPASLLQAKVLLLPCKTGWRNGCHWSDGHWIFLLAICPPKKGDDKMSIPGVWKQPSRWNRWENQVDVPIHVSKDKHSTWHQSTRQLVFQCLFGRGLFWGRVDFLKIVQVITEDRGVYVVEQQGLTISCFKREIFVCHDPSTWKGMWIVNFCASAQVSSVFCRA